MRRWLDAARRSAKLVRSGPSMMSGASDLGHVGRDAYPLPGEVITMSCLLCRRGGSMTGRAL